MYIRFLQIIISWIARSICGASVFTKDVDLNKLGQTLFFANHSSHFDFIAIWSSLPSNIRTRVRPVAALDYWGKPGLRQFLSQRIFNSILIERSRANASDDPLKEVKEALALGDSIIIFPEGTRSLDGSIQDFKSGLFHLAQDCPNLPLVPVGLTNLNRILPKGEFLVVPLLSRVIFGAPLYYESDEAKSTFLNRAKTALEALT